MTETFGQRERRKEAAARAGQTFVERMGIWGFGPDGKRTWTAGSIVWFPDGRSMMLVDRTESAADIVGRATFREGL